MDAYDINILHEAGRSIFGIQKIEIHPDWLYQAVQYDADIVIVVVIGFLRNIKVNSGISGLSFKHAN